MRFTTTVLGAGKTAAGIEVPPAIVESLGAGRRPPVRVTIAAYTYRSTVAVLGGAFMIGVSAAVRAEAGVRAGDVVEVELELDTEPREVVVPEDLAAALDAQPEARRAFDRLAYSNRRRIAEPVASAATAETRQRRIDSAVRRLLEGRS